MCQHKIHRYNLRKVQPKTTKLRHFEHCHTESILTTTEIFYLTIESLCKRSHILSRESLNGIKKTWSQLVGARKLILPCKICLHRPISVTAQDQAATGWPKFIWKKWLNRCAWQHCCLHYSDPPIRVSISWKRTLLTWANIWQLCLRSRSNFTHPFREESK